jgi:tetratricopeptide (TPR) repeat protein
MLKFFITSRAFFVFLSVIILLSPGLLAQVPKKTSKNAKSNLTKSKTPRVALNEQDEFDKAVALADLNEKVKALEKFITNFPKSEKKNEALEIIASIRAVWADDKLRAGDLETSLRLFKEAINGAPNPIPEGLFANVILPIPNKLYFIGQQAEALKIATAIESKVKDDPKQLLGLATFYISIENAEGARMLAQSAINLDATMPAAYQTLGLSYRLKFDLEEAEKSYAKALELGPDSAVSKRGLAEMKRAAGKSEEALAIYRELVEKDPNDATARNGLILALFDAGQRDEA